MAQLLDRPQDLGVIVGLIDRVTDQIPQLGKTQFQKLVYFLQETGIPLGFKYEIYHYGPYSFDLSNVMDTLDTLGVIDVSTDPAGYGFHISTGRFSEKYQPQPKDIKKIEELLNVLGALTPANLEVKATLHFVNKVLQKRNQNDRESVIEKVQALKPRFDRRFIANCYDDLQRANLM